MAAGSSLTFGAPVTVNSGQILNPSGSGTVNYLSTIAVSNTASMTIANSTHSTGLTVGTGGTVAIAGPGTALEVDSLSNNGTITVNSNNSIFLDADRQRRDERNRHAEHDERRPAWRSRQAWGRKV